MREFGFNNARIRRSYENGTPRINGQKLQPKHVSNYVFNSWSRRIFSLISKNVGSWYGIAYLASAGVSVNASVYAPRAWWALELL